ncbi:MAG: hypothetical protein Q4C71_05890 [Microbacteriaceae bacterium]|nr:hypothetical protein [Microbacteriaceae bacterium]
MLDLQGAGSPETYATWPFKWAMCAQFVVWGLGMFGILREIPRARAEINRRRAALVKN